ncbi:MAG: polysaccharide biosynthesis/export family protein, partial [Planctomycetota bacterium]
TLSEQSYVYVLGKVNRPGRFAYRADREQMTLLKAITLAGDFHQFARPSAIKILRKEGKRTRVREYDFDEIIDGEIQDIVLEPDDVMFVPESPF